MGSARRMTHYAYERSGRTYGAALVVGAVWAALLAAWIWLEAALWVILPLALFTVPAVIDLLRNPASGMRLTADSLSWYSGRRHAEVKLSEVEHIRLDTRLDFSVRASAVLHTGRRIRLPFESTPPHQPFEDALKTQDIKVLRFHFQLFQ